MRLFRRKPKPQPLRRGFITMTSPYNAQIEVSEWETSGDLSRVTVDDVSGVQPEDMYVVRYLVKRWIPTHSVRWF